MIRLYRAVSEEELDDIRRCQKFQPNQSSMEGKWFAESPENAAEWGKRFYSWEAKPFYIVQIELSEFVGAQMYRISNLDNIGSARYADGDLLEFLNNYINSTGCGIIELPAISL